MGHLQHGSSKQTSWARFDLRGLLVAFIVLWVLGKDRPASKVMIPEGRSRPALLPLGGLRSTGSDEATRPKLSPLAYT